MIAAISALSVQICLSNENVNFVPHESEAGTPREVVHPSSWGDSRDPLPLSPCGGNGVIRYGLEGALPKYAESDPPVPLVATIPTGSRQFTYPASALSNACWAADPYRARPGFR